MWLTMRRSMYCTRSCSVHRMPMRGFGSLMSMVDTIPSETLRQSGTLPWYGMAYALDDFLVYAYYGHKREHSAQIAAFRDVLNRR